MNIIAKIVGKTRQVAYSIYIHKRKRNELKHLTELRRRNNQEQCTIICNNCIAGIIYHNLGLRFDSPTINLAIKGEEYLEFCKHLEYYSSCELIEHQDSMKEGYPVGVIMPKDDQHIRINIYFQHYHTFEESKAKWVERFKRVDYNNIFFIWEFYDTAYDHKLMYEFDALPLENKMILTHRNFPNLKNAFCVTCYADDKPVAKILDYNGVSGKRYLDEFDYVGFINRE